MNPVLDETAMDDLRDRLAARAMTPLWDSLHQLVPAQPYRHYRPHLWRYDEARSFLMEAAGLISAEQAERRVLILQNPDLAEPGSTTPTLYAGIQLVMPGEIAPAHRHSQSALRFVLEGEDAVTAVDGEEIAMRPGDLVLTPNWRWHDHANETSKPMLWLDGLDIPILRFFNAGFMERPNAKATPRSRAAGDGRSMFGQGLLPADWQATEKASPQVHYRYADARAALMAVTRTELPDPCHGWRMRYINPATGGPVLATITCYLRHMPAGFASVPYRATDSRVFVATEGSGVATIDGEKFPFAVNDVFVVPGWASVSIRADAETILFEMSDRAVQEELDLWREDRARGGDA